MRNKNIEKKCSRCGIEKNIVEFGKDKKTKDGLNRWCRYCSGRLSREYKCKNKEKVAQYAKTYRLKNKEKTRQYRKQYVSKNKKELNEKTKQYRLKNKAKEKEWAKRAYLKHIDKRHEYEAKRYLRRKAYCYKKNKEWRIKNRERRNAMAVLERKNNLGVKILHNLRTRVYSALRGRLKSDRTIVLVGCTVPEFKNYLEKHFVEGMTWDNYGKGMSKWNLDHINPCAIFNLADPVEQKQCFHYSNLRPLWERGDNGNLVKNNRTDGLKLLYNDSTPFIIF